MSNSSASAGNVVVIDSGLSSAWNTGRLVYQHDFYGNDNDVMVANANTHGALVTAEILENAPDVGIIALKVMPDDGSGASETNIEKALQWVVANADAYNITAVNLSLGGGAQTTAATTSISDELATLAAKRVLTVAAAGNSGDGGATQSVSSYSADVNQICVSASTGDGAFPSWAQRSPSLTDVCADGTDVRITNLSGVTYTANGSSFAAPAVTAAVAKAQQAWVEQTGTRLTQGEFLDLARGTGKAMGTAGYFELDTDALLAKIAQSAPVPTAQSATTITINASGAPAGGVNAHFKLLVDGKTVGQATVDSAAKDYSFTANLTADQAHKVQVQYDNDGFVNGQDRNLFVNKVTINGTAHSPTAANVTYDKGALDGKDVVKGQSSMWWGGTLVVDAPAKDFPVQAAPANTTITVNASGAAAGGVNAHFNLLVDGQKVGEGVAGTAAKDFTFATNLTADQAHKVQVQYDNDAVVNGQDRSLFVNKVTISGHAVAPTASNVTYDKGALDGKDVVKGQAGLWWNGTLVVDADKSWFPSATGTGAVASAQSANQSANQSADGQDTVWQHLVAQGLEAAAPSHGDHAALLHEAVPSMDAYANAAALGEHHPDPLHPLDMV
ncbi:carbohydrate-binding domain-containing protein [Azospirillum himalayense]|uniref:Carbohydrate-binding domain-containing protein n=1 Tax=Azospirillum himalayense TaxID=654847 RepID=A0ABW0G2H8_9PROT